MNATRELLPIDEARAASVRGLGSAPTGPSVAVLPPLFVGDTKVRIMGKTVEIEGLLYPVGREQRPACGHVPENYGEFWNPLMRCAICECAERGIEPLYARLGQGQKWLPSSGGCHGVNHRHIFDMGECTSCQAVVARKGKGLIAVIRRSTDMGESFRPVCWSRHECDPYRQASVALHRANQIGSGELVVGQTVEVVKGRKVPKGTVGIVRWRGEDNYKPGSYRLGLSVEGQEKLVYTAESNVEARPPA